MLFSSCFRAHAAAALFTTLVPICVSAQDAASGVVVTQGSGTLTGRVINEASGLGVANATVRIEGTTLETNTDVMGNYRLEGVPAGSRELVVTKSGLMPARVTDVRVADGEVTVQHAPVTAISDELRESVVKMEAFTVSAEVVQGSGLGLLNARQRAPAVSDAISSDQMSRLGFGTAAAAMRAVTGASIVGGKYVYIRGLGERYSTTMVNGVELPSADPDRRAVNMDMFPSDLVDAIVTTKTFTPDKPGNFTGGAVDLKTKEFPEDFTYSVSASIGYNSQVTGKDFLTYDGGSRGLGWDDGTRELPNALKDGRIPLRFTSPAVDAEIGALTRTFKPVMNPSVKEAPLNRSLGFAIGGLETLFGRNLGYAASLSYDRSFSGYSDGFFGRYELQGVDAPALQPLVMLDDVRSDEEVLLGGLLNVAYQISSDHQVSVNTMFNQSGADVARIQSGLNIAGGGISDTDIFTTRTLRYTERSLSSVQLQGKHLLPALRETRVQWSATAAKNTQDEPDTRYFSTFQTPDGNEFFEASGLPRPSRYFRDLEESRRDYSVDITVPFQQWNGLEAHFKFGGAYADTTREFNERLFDYNSTVLRYDGDADGFLRESQVGNVDPVTGRFLPGQLYLVETTSEGNSYDGDQEVTAFYAMVDLPLTPALRLVAGARQEKTVLDVRSRDPGRRSGYLDNNDTLPSANVVYALGKKMNLRAAWTKTLARPNFREIADYTSFEFVGDFVYIGNPDLRRTEIDNFDFRWEWFPRASELVAASVFHKRMTDPIERGVFSVINSGELQFQNAPAGRVTGVELEARKKLDFISPVFEGFSGGVNFTWVESEVEITPAELQFIRFYNPDAPDTRELTGQSPYLLNLDLTYVNPNWGSTVSVYYNVFGERLSLVSPPGTPNVFEQPAPTLDFVWNQRVGERWKFTFSAKNLLNSAYEEKYEYRDVEYLRAYRKRGVLYSIGLTYPY